MKTRDLILIALLSITGICAKRFISPVFNLITDFIYIPGGSTAGGIYMMFLTLGAVIIKRRHVAVYIGFLQGFFAIILGVSSMHGLFALIIYTVPGIVIDFVLSLKKENDLLPILMLANCLGNVSGSLMTNYLFFNLSPIPTLLFFALSIISGSLGGYLAFLLLKRLKFAIPMEV